MTTNYKMIGLDRMFFDAYEKDNIHSPWQICESHQIHSNRSSWIFTSHLTNLKQAEPYLFMGKAPAIINAEHSPLHKNTRTEKSDEEFGAHRKWIDSHHQCWLTLTPSIQSYRIHRID